jgi:Protein of unknown function (DUF2975)
MITIMKDPVLHFTSALVSALKWAFWFGMVLCVLILIFSTIATVADMSVDPHSAAAAAGNENPRYVPILMALGATLCFLFARFFKILRNVIDSVGEGSPLSTANAAQLIRMAKLLGTILVLGLVADASSIYWLPASEGCESGNFDMFYDIVTNFFLTLLPILLLVILARIFHLGAAMREELEGTV